MFSWIDFLAPGAVAHAVLAFSIVVALGLALGSVGSAASGLVPLEYCSRASSWVRPGCTLTKAFWNLPAISD
jgi:hypothetical protein